MLPEHYEHAALTVLLWVVNSEMHITVNVKWKIPQCAPHAWGIICQWAGLVFSSKSQTVAYPNEVEFSA